MIPLRRCGSHAIRLRLSANPDFYAPYPLHLVDFMPLVEYYGDLEDDANYFRLVTDYIGFANTSLVRWSDVDLDPVHIFNLIKDEKRSIHTINWALLSNSAQRHDAKVVMCKSLDNIQYADELMEMFGDLQFLNVVRDPRDQISSINRAIIYNFDTLLNTKLWHEAYTKATELAEKYPERVLTVRFEDFIENQEEFLRKVCDFINIEFVEDMLDVSKSSEASDLTHRSALWQSNMSAPIKANVGKFRKTLSLEEIELIESVCGDLMDRYGYERITEGKTIITEAMEDQAMADDDANKKMAWNDLKTEAPQDYIMRKFRNDYLADLERRLTR
jgi:hypothetical protein